MLNPYNTEFSDIDLLDTANYLKSKGLSDAQAGEILGMMRRGEVEMSQNDGVTITQSEPDVPGAYIDASQKLQDVYAQSPMAQRQMASGMQQAPAYFNQVGDMNLSPVPLSNPNARTEEARTTTVDANGNIVIF